MYTRITRFMNSEMEDDRLRDSESTSELHFRRKDFFHPVLHAVDPSVSNDHRGNISMTGLPFSITELAHSASNDVWLNGRCA
jgi:hypothetical protein